MLTQDEAELYDRQIRLWGVNAQSRLRQSKVLMLGFNGVASEVAKTLVLAGIDTLTIVDDLPLQKSDLTSSLFCRPQSAGDNGKQQYRTHQVKEKLKVLNPLVKVNIDNSSILSKKSEDFKNYDLITLHSFMPIEQIESINQACREVNVKFYLVIDFGFFGFVFNDLGQEFKFTHEEYDKLAEGKDLNNQALVNKQSGEEGDPINFDDEDDENNDTQSSDDIKRPRKRRRHHSPPPPTPNQTKDKKKKVTSLSYVPFRKMISFQGASFDRKSSPALVLSMAMLKFYTENNRLAGQSETGEVSEGESMKKDISRLNAIIDTLKEELNLPTSIFKRLDPDWSSNIIGSLSPVCAVVGGVAGQDMIRSLSNNDIPICNTFSFDGMDMSGVVERLGIVDSSKNVAPVIRDFLELD